MSLPHGPQLVERARGGDQAHQLVCHLATPRRCALTAVRGRRGRPVPAALAGIHLSTCAVCARLLLVTFIGQQPPHRRGGRLVHRCPDLAPLAGRACMARGSEGDSGKGSAAAECSRRGQSRASRVVPAVRARFSAALSSRRQGQRTVVLRRVRIAHRGNARVSRFDHGRGGQCSDVRRFRRRSGRQARPRR